MNQKPNLNLTSAEIAHLWNTYISDSMAICVISHFLANTQDSDVKPVLEKALSISEGHLKEIKQIFQEEKYAVPYGFTEKDVDVQAPALFIDSFYLHYIKQMSRVGINAYGLGVSLAVRKDIRTFYNSALSESMALDDQVTNVLLHKGLYVRAPYVIGPEKVEFVEKTSFLNGILGDRRPLLSMEVAHLYGNIQTASLGKALCIGFSQAATSKAVTNFMIKSRGKAGKHIDMLGDKLNSSYLRVPLTWNDVVTNSTKSPFSEKLMMFHINTVMATALADYGVALAASIRKDLALMYGSIIAEMGMHLEDGAKIMIQNGWFEKPPQVSDRDQLAKKN